MNNFEISIVTYKTNTVLLTECLDSIKSSTIKSNATIIDNSPNDSIKSIVARYGFDYVHLPHNPGYGTAHNIAIRKSIEKNSSYHLVLNADVHFSPDIFEKIMFYMNAHQNVALVMPKVLNPDGTIQRLCKLVPTPVDLIVRRFLPDFLSKRIQQRFELWEIGYDKIMFVPYLSGCFMFLRCSALKEVGVFDERFFLYTEDIDLSRRLASKFDTHFFPFASVVHEHGAASYKSIRMLLTHIISAVKYFNKWGWFFDKDRNDLNNKTFRLLAEKNSS